MKVSFVWLVGWGDDDDDDDDDNDNDDDDKDEKEMMSPTLWPA